MASKHTREFDEIKVSENVFVTVELTSEFDLNRAGDDVFVSHRGWKITAAYDWDGNELPIPPLSAEIKSAVLDRYDDSEEFNDDRSESFWDLEFSR